MIDSSLMVRAKAGFPGLEEMVLQRHLIDQQIEFLKDQGERPIVLEACLQNEYFPEGLLPEDLAKLYELPWLFGLSITRDFPSLDILHHHSDLRFLDVSSLVEPKISDGVERNIDLNHLSSLVYLGLPKGRFGGDKYYFEACRNIRAVSLGETHYNCRDLIKVLLQFKYLREFSAFGLHWEDIDFLVDFPNLTVIELISCVTLSRLPEKELSSLELLSIYSASNLSDLGGLLNCEALDVIDLQKCPKLTTIDFSSGKQVNLSVLNSQNCPLLRLRGGSRKSLPGLQYLSWVEPDPALNQAELDDYKELFSNTSRPCELDIVVRKSNQRMGLFSN